MSKCPHCGRDIHLAQRISGDTVWCPCGAELTVYFRASGASLISRVPLATLAPQPETSAQHRRTPRRRKGGQP